MFGLLSDQPQYSDKIKPFIAIAPPVYLNNYYAPLLRLLARDYLFVNYVRDHPSPCFTSAGSDLYEICSNKMMKLFCDLIAAMSLEATNYNATRIDVYLSHIPAGSSCWDFIHFSQRMINENFTYIDLGDEMNLERYGSKSPPIYNLQSITNQHIAIIQSTGDNKANPKDVQKLLDQLKGKQSNNII